MRILLFGATGMVGQGVLRECLRSDAVSEVVAPVRQTMPVADPKLRQVVGAGPTDWAFGPGEFFNFHACFFCIGVSAVGMSEIEYREKTQFLTLTIAQAVVTQSPQAVFVYVSGRGTDANGRAMWARVKGETENALMALPFRDVFCFRPGYIQPLHGIRSKVWWYQAVYDTLGWGYPLLRRLAPDLVTTSEAVGLAMLHVARSGWKTKLLETAEINRAASAEAT